MAFGAHRVGLSGPTMSHVHIRSTLLTDFRVRLVSLVGVHGI